ncbi:hypothetical protein RIR_jg21873.t1 [Rhizophagus irregularis DAOM 181602=DAOM 197198]|nr:hypothetical protein RIR_jg21873.t1 [Rhizophagus irregularis DAOM 181602=DAOM 197198]
MRVPFHYAISLSCARISIAPKQRTNIKINYCSIKNSLGRKKRKFLINVIYSHQFYRKRMNLITPKERRFLKLEEVIPKVEELKSIFKKCGEEMEWEAIKENLRMIVIQYRQNFTTLNNDFTKKVKEEEQ